MDIGTFIVLARLRQLNQLPESVTNPDQFAKDFARRIKEKHPYVPVDQRYRFCSWSGGDCSKK